MVLCLVLAIAACDEIWKDYAGVSGHSFMVGDQFVILNNGYRRGQVTWVVVRSWPSASTSEQRRTDGRFSLGRDGEYRVRQQSGELTLPAPGMPMCSMAIV